MMSCLWHQQIEFCTSNRLSAKPAVVEWYMYAGRTAGSEGGSNLGCTFDDKEVKAPSVFLSRLPKKNKNKEP